jgi:mono/diheme cytochrome c family protein
MRRIALPLMLICLLVLTAVLAGCGSTSTTTTVAPTTVTTAATTTSASTAPATTQTSAPATTETTAPPVTDTTAASANDGKTLYQDNCSSCHGANGEGGAGPMIAGSSRSGVVKTVTNGRGDMPSFQGRLAADQIEAIAGYVSTLK